jgi:hypothetical protein
MKQNVSTDGIDLAKNLFGGVSNVDIDGSNAWQIKAIGVVISTFETLPSHKLLCCHVQERGEGHAPPPRAHPPLHMRRAHAATATALREVTCPPRAAAVRPGPAPDSVGWPA